MAVLEKQPSETLAFLYVFSSKNDFFNTLLIKHLQQKQERKWDKIKKITFFLIQRDFTNVYSHMHAFLTISA